MTPQIRLKAQWTQSAPRQWRITVGKSLFLLASASLGLFNLPTAQAIADPSSMTSAGEAPSERLQDRLTMRDPFKRPVLVAPDTTPKSELEAFPLDQLKMIGVLTGPKKLKAMILAPDGKTYFVSENARIGLKRGVILRITADRIRVREKMVNVLGQEENIDTDLLLPSSQVSASASSQSKSQDQAQLSPGGLQNAIQNSLQRSMMGPTAPEGTQ